MGFCVLKHCTIDYSRSVFFYMLKYRPFHNLIFSSLMLMISSAHVTSAQEILPTSALKKLSVEELMNIEVTSVSRHPEKLSKTASAIQVITQEDIQRFGATRLPEVLRLATNLQVTQLNSGEWSVSARGFNSPTSNKLLVLIDGRTVYSPLFAGVFWDVQNFLLEDIDRIEVISGPGGTQWGANAVNGVINIITKSAKETKGLFVKAAAGNEMKAAGALRYGLNITNHLHARAYGQYIGYDAAVHPDGSATRDGWNQTQTGFRLDWDNENNDVITVQGDLYKSKLLTFKKDSLTLTRGFNMLSRWSHRFNDKSDIKIQLYFDRVHRGISNSYDDGLNTYDFDCQYRFPVGKRHDVVSGIGYRMIDDNFAPDVIELVPSHRSLSIYTAFLQDEIALVNEKLFLILGSKAQHNDYTGFEFQPSARLAWNLLSKQQTLWGAISRAVRTPSRIDRDLVIPNLLTGSDFRSEALVAYELGYRIQPHERLAFSLATYFNDYNKIRSVEQIDPPNPTPEKISNKLLGESYGSEFTMDYELATWWRLRAGYTYLHVNVWKKQGSTDTSMGASETNDPHHIFSLRSSLDCPANIKLFPMFRYVSRINKPMDVPGYGELDVRVSWQPKNNLDVSLVGQNLLHAHHAEFGMANTRNEIQRNIFLRVIWRY
jgi:iron complex outermembrane receptor protein